MAGCALLAASLAVGGCRNDEDLGVKADPPGVASDSVSEEAPADATPGDDGQILDEDSAEQDETSGPYAEADLPAYRNEDGELLCPVMEVILDSEDVAEGFQDYKGVRYWFSTAESAEMFRDNPEKFAK
ncbi:MAG: hypothetical protein IIC73_08805 [Armatimonadetes bacterium]|nr:hypothetical protein [Armatimonadota bacterium]